MCAPGVGVNNSARCLSGKMKTAIISELSASGEKAPGDNMADGGHNYLISEKRHLSASNQYQKYRGRKNMAENGSIFLLAHGGAVRGHGVDQHDGISENKRWYNNSAAAATRAGWFSALRLRAHCRRITLAARAPALPRLRLAHNLYITCGESWAKKAGIRLASRWNVTS